MLSDTMGDKLGRGGFFSGLKIPFFSYGWFLEVFDPCLI
jgi:hypothetical protein